MGDSESLLSALIEELRANIEPSRASFERREGDSVVGGGIIHSLIPSNIKAATIVAHADKRFDVIDFVFGRKTPLEVPLAGGRYTRNEGIDEARALCLGVIHGNFKEDLWVEEARIVKSRGVIAVEGRDIRIYSGPLILNPFKVRLIEHVQYQPY